MVRPDGGPGEFFTTPAACFVTLRMRQGDSLRGCIGQLSAREPLWQAVVNNAERAATKDFRFDAVRPEELDSLRIEISVLSPSVELSFSSPQELLDQLVPGRDGVILRVGSSVGTFLPQVWDDLKEKEVFLNHLARKAGAEADAWRGPGAGVSVYRVVHFEEP